MALSYGILTLLILSVHEHSIFFHRTRIYNSKTTKDHKEPQQSLKRTKPEISHLQISNYATKPYKSIWYGTGNKSKHIDQWYTAENP